MEDAVEKSREGREEKVGNAGRDSDEGNERKADEGVSLAEVEICVFLQREDAEGNRVGTYQVELWG